MVWQFDINIKKVIKMCLDFMNVSMIVLNNEFKESIRQ
jgi:hypothetical protein